MNPIFRKARLAAAVMILCNATSAGAAAASQTYWVCTDAQGVKTAQDHPCDPVDPSKNRREARPNVVPSTGPGVVETAVPPEVRSRVEHIAAQAPPVPPWVIKVAAGLGIMIGGLVVLSWIRRLIDWISSRKERHENQGIGRDEARTGAKASMSLFGFKPKAWSLEVIRSLGPKRFEELCAGLWSAEGYRTESVGEHAEGGVAIRYFHADDPSRLIGIIQCHSGPGEPVGVGFVRELFGNIAEARAMQGVLATASEFTADSKVYAGGKPMELVDGGMLLERLQALPQGRRSVLLKQILRRGFRK